MRPGARWDAAATQPGWRRHVPLIKEVAGRVAAALLVVLLAPVLAAIAIAVRSDGGPVFSRQTRVGQHGRTFELLTFRSTVAATEQTGESPELSPRGRSDAGFTRFGGFLRRSELDELPQLFNVLTGTLSLVGPRPPLPEEVSYYDRSRRSALLVKPGLFSFSRADRHREFY